MAHTNMVQIEGVSFELAAFLSRLLTPILETPTSLWSDLCVAFERERNIVEEFFECHFAYHSLLFVRYLFRYPHFRCHHNHPSKEGMLVYFEKLPPTTDPSWAYAIDAITKSFIIKILLSSL